MENFSEWTMKPVFSKCTCFSSDEINNGPSHFLACAPCPPPVFEYYKFVSFAAEQNLSSCEIDEIATKCRLEPPLSFENNTRIPSDNVTLDYFEVTDKTLKPWVIPFIVISCVIATTALLILTVFIRQRNRSNGDSGEVKSKHEPHKQHQQQQFEKVDRKSKGNGTAGVLNAAFSNFERLTHERDIGASDNDKEMLTREDNRNIVDVDSYTQEQQTDNSTIDTYREHISEGRNPIGESL